jgi:uncharacterized protein YeaO (DUF488 family)
MQMRLLVANPAAKWLTVLLLTATTVTAVAANRYYRYINDDGVTVLDSRIPPRYVKKGYEVVTATGQVLQVVPPAPSEEEMEQLAARREQEAKMAEWDSYLMRRYSSIADIEAARERKLADFDASMSILRGNANSIESQISDLQSRAANLERSGRPVPDVLLENLVTLQSELGKAERQIESRLLEKRDLEERFESEIQRFSQIRPAD